MHVEGNDQPAMQVGRLLRGVLPALLMWLLLPAWPALAGPAASSRGTSDATAPGSATATPITAAQAQQVLDVLNDPQKRAAFSRTLTAMARGLPAATVAAPAAPAKALPSKVTLAPDSLGSELLSEVGSAQLLVLTQARAFGRMFGDTVLVTRWLSHELRDPASRLVLYDAAWRAALVFVGSLIVERLLALLLRRPLRALSRDARVTQEEDLAGRGIAAPAPTGVPHPPASMPGDPADVAREEAEQQDAAEHRQRDARHRWRTLRTLKRLPFALLRLLIKLVPVGTVLAIGNIAGTGWAQQPVSQLVIVTITNLYGFGRLLYLLLDMLVAPDAPGVRLLSVTDSTAVLLCRWWTWLIAVPVVAVAVTDIGGLIALPQRAAQSIIRAIVLIEHILLAGLIWRTRVRVGNALQPPRRLRETATGAVLARLAHRWWIPAMFFDFALWLVWAAQVQNGYQRIWRLFVMTVVIIVVCRFVALTLLGLLDRLFRVSPELEQHYPGLEMRANRWYPLLRRVVNAIMLAAGAVLLLQSWGLPALSWFTQGRLGTRMVSALLSVLVALILGVVAWEGVNAALDRQIASFGRSAQTARAVRLQTLLPILRTVLLITLGAIVLLTILSEIGINVAPLLAGAGILGVAIGFGSQKLVQDFITGIFLLVENAMQVGDTVTAAGVTGTVEHLSIRTLRLRGGDGSVQIIPFSSVTTVSNQSRDFAVAAIALTIAVAEDTDRVCVILKEVGAGLRADPSYTDFALADFALNGVDSINEYSTAISGTMKCTVGGRWAIQREFYRRLRIALQEARVALPSRPLSIPDLHLAAGPTPPSTPTPETA
ncbi:mechanosensitive ion channel [Lichenicoccus roseus]|uniref:Mechanosensitive ion channel n=2 Tax=Lichenicoccus roseus TaxID=2683649 RepID=A0A5R9J678_9PROT|nr:mechanosensitive ion channel [Lichenicoccus roseus]